MLAFPNTKLEITETVLRDAHQSQAATRMKTADMLTACGELNRAGYWSVECWGGATYDACLRYLNEDPWERLRVLRRAMPDVKLQMLLRGQSLLGYRHYADDAVELFCRKSIENGINVVRIFDALNDVRNMETAMKSVKKYGGICEAAVSYTTGPVFDDDYFVELAMALADRGADVICIKDMANLLLPDAAFSLISKMKEKVGLPIHLHTHDTCGTGGAVYLAAALAGVDIVDCALSPFAGGTSQPATETVAAMFEETPRKTGLNGKALQKAAEHFRGVAQNLRKEGFIKTSALHVKPEILRSQVPGGMLSNLMFQLREAGAADKMDEVLAEVPRVRADFGYPPLVTPTSQIVGTQAFLNVIAGERYRTFSKESAMLLAGEYGKLPGQVNEDVRRRAIGDKKPIDCRPADRLSPELETARKEFKNLIQNDEDLLSCILFPQIAPEFLRRRKEEIPEVEVFFDGFY